MPYVCTVLILYIHRLLNYEPGLRPHAAQCLLHSFIKGMSASLTPPVCSPICVPQEEFDFERRKLTLDDLRAELTHEGNVYISVIRILRHFLIGLNCVYSLLLQQTGATAI